MPSRDRVIAVLAKAIDEWNGRENWPPHVSEDEAAYLLRKLEDAGLINPDWTSSAQNHGKWHA